MASSGRMVARGFWIPSLSAVRSGGRHRLRIAETGEELWFEGPLHPWRGGWVPGPSVDGVLVPADRVVPGTANPGSLVAGSGHEASTWRVRWNLAEAARTDLAADPPPADLAWALGWLRTRDVDPGMGVGRWARDLGLNPDVLGRRIRDWMGCTPVALLQWWRVDRALGCLREGRGDRKALSAACGFASVRDFHRVFLGVTGLTPGVYQRLVVPPIPMDTSSVNMDKTTGGSPGVVPKVISRMYGDQICP